MKPRQTHHHLYINLVLLNIKTEYRYCSHWLVMRWGKKAHQRRAFLQIASPTYYCKKIYDFVETYIAESAHHQKTSFDRHAQTRTFQVGDSVWLSIPTAGKLDPRWEGKWVVHSIPGPTSYTITDGKRFRTVHVNRLQQRMQPDANDPQSDVVTDHTTWQPPSVEHQVITEEEIVEPHLDAQAQPIGGSRYPSRVRQPPERLRF